MWPLELYFGLAAADVGSIERFGRYGLASLKFAESKRNDCISARRWNWDDCYAVFVQQVGEFQVWGDNLLAGSSFNKTFCRKNFFAHAVGPLPPYTVGSEVDLATPCVQYRGNPAFRLGSQRSCFQHGN